jgi:uncharacterized protein
MRIRTLQSPDLLTVQLSYALLHDVLDKKYVLPLHLTDTTRGPFSSPLFKREGEGKGAIELEADGQAEVIVRIVENVSLVERGAWYETCVELHCVQDADRLDSIGVFGTFLSLSHLIMINDGDFFSVGIMRRAAYSAITKRKVSIYPH